MMEEKSLCSYDILSLQECPAFKESCPFKNLVDEDFMKVLKECPEFQDQCPFKDATNLAEIYEKLSQIPDPQSPAKHLSELFTAMHSVSETLEQNLGYCPVFSSGCPFKKVENDGITLVDPVDSVSKQQTTKNELMKFVTSEIKQKCPAFHETCPYAKLANENFKNCPAFTDGCPYKNGENLAEVYDLLSKIKDPQSPEKNLLNVFKNIHTVSVNEKRIYGNCPVFHDDGKPSCPFKSVRSDGKHLLHPVSDVVQK